MDIPFASELEQIRTGPDGRFLPRHGMRQSAFYNVWCGIRKRCNRPSHKSYPRYGGRGIKCEWDSFESFRDDMYVSYIEHRKSNTNTSIERIDNDKNYNKENCRWANAKEQANNRSNNTIIEIGGVSKTLTQWAEQVGIKVDTMIWRFYKFGATPKILKSSRLNGVNHGNTIRK